MNSPLARVHRINISQGGVPKLPVRHARVNRLGLEGDAVAHPRVHGGPERAVCLYAQERIDGLRGEGHAIDPGSLGENVTTIGVDWSRLRPGDRFEIGDVILRVTNYAAPCLTTAPFVGGNARRIHEGDAPGWSRVYAAVEREGTIETGMPLVHRSHSNQSSTS